MVPSAGGSLVFHVIVIGLLVAAHVLSTDLPRTSAVEQISLVVVMDHADEVPPMEPITLNWERPADDDLSELRPQVRRKTDLSLRTPRPQLRDVEVDPVRAPDQVARDDRASPEPVAIDRTVAVQVERQPIMPQVIATKIPDLPTPAAVPSEAPLSAVPQLVRRTEAAYPAALRNQGIEGTVYLWIEIDEHGRVADASVKRSSGYVQLDRAAIAAARQWQFTPARRAARPVALRVTMPIVFRIVR